LIWHDNVAKLLTVRC